MNARGRSLFEGLPASVPEALALRRQRPDDLFVVGPDFQLTFGESDVLSSKLASRLLAAGVGKGTRLGVLHANDPDWVVSWLAGARIGALTVPLSTFAPGPELVRVLRHTDVSSLLTTSSFLQSSLSSRLEEGLEGLAGSGPSLTLEQTPYLRWIHVNDSESLSWSRPLSDLASEALVRAAESQVVPADPLVMVNTSGTTSGPKSVVHTHGSLIRHSALMAQLRSLRPSDRLFCPMPFFWVGGLTTSLLYALTSGCTLLTQIRFEPGEALDLIEREAATLIQVWPNAAQAMAEHPSFGMRNLRSVRGGTVPEALPQGRRPASSYLYPGLFGMTETGGPHSNPDDPYSPLPVELRGTFGIGVPGVDRKVVDLESFGPAAAGDPGELHVRGPFVMDQIYKSERHETFDRDGWYPTGDICSIDDRGFLRFHGRKSLMIKTGGSNVAPNEVEEVLRESPMVKVAYVLGIPYSQRGEAVVAVVVPNDGFSPDDQVLAGYVRSRLSTYKVPRQWAFVTEGAVPLLPNGKADIQSLRGIFVS